jgi:acetolactate synthase-1/2/3 large subunit
MNGAESLVRTLLAGGVNVCFTNPGTSEMHFVTALDRVDGMRCVLGLFEGVVTGAADGYGRMADKPASTLLHLGPGLANGLANLHNANRASTPVVNIVGDHATYHRRYDAPLTSDIEGAARPFSHWVKTSPSATTVAEDGAAAIAAARMPPGRIATLVLPADTAWNDATTAGSTGIASVPAVPARVQTSREAIANAVTVLRSGAPTVLLLSGLALREHGLAVAGRIAQATGAKLLCQTSNARIQRGAGRVAIDRVPYPVDQALALLKDVRHVILIGAKAPVAFFAYPNKPSVMTPEGCAIHTLATPAEDAVHALDWLADELGVTARPAPVEPAKKPELPSGAITLDALAAAIGALLPDQAVVVDESITSGRNLFPYTRGAAPHDWLQNMGGSIGIGLPMATGAAVACPDRRVVCLESDGSGMYTLQALWTQAREKLDVTTVLFSNRVYGILKIELANVGAQNPGRKALDMLEIGRPDLDWVGLAQSMGVEASRATTIDEFIDQFRAGLRKRGPHLIEVVL